MHTLQPRGPAWVRAAGRWTRQVDRHAVEVFSGVACLLLATSWWDWRTSDPTSARVAGASLLLAAGIGLGTAAWKAWRRHPSAPPRTEVVPADRRSPKTRRDQPVAPSAPPPALMGSAVGTPG